MAQLTPIAPDQIVETGKGRLVKIGPEDYIANTEGVKTKGKLIYPLNAAAAGTVGMPHEAITATREAINSPVRAGRAPGYGQPLSTPQGQTQPGYLERHTYSPQEVSQGVAEATGIPPIRAESAGGRIAQDTAAGAIAGAPFGVAGVAGGALSAASSSTAAEAGASPAVQNLIGATAAVLGGATVRPRFANVPELQDIRAQSQQSYQTAAAAGVIIPPPTLVRLAADMVHDAQAAGIHPSVHSSTHAALTTVLQDFRTARTLPQLDTLRQLISDAGRASPGDARIAAMMRNRLDQFIQNLTPADVLLAGDPVAGAAALRQARDLWNRYSKSETIHDALYAAGLDKNFDTGMVREVKKILKDDQPRGWTGPEVRTMENLVRGGNVKRFLDWAGQFSPRGLIGVTEALSASLSPGTAAIPVGGLIARTLGRGMTRSRATALDQLVRSGGQPPALTPARIGTQNRTLVGGMSALGTRKENQ